MLTNQEFSHSIDERSKNDDDQNKRVDTLRTMFDYKDYIIVNKSKSRLKILFSLWSNPSSSLVHSENFSGWNFLRIKQKEYYSVGDKRGSKCLWINLNILFGRDLLIQMIQYNVVEVS